MTLTPPKQNGGVKDGAPVTDPANVLVADKIELQALIDTLATKKTDWHKSAATLITAVSLLFVIIGTIANIGFSFFGYRAIQTQIAFQREAQRQNSPVDFQLVQQVDRSGEGLLTLRNAGESRIVNISARIRFFFAFPDGKVYTVSELSELISEGPELLQRCLDANLVSSGMDIEFLVEPPRKFEVAWVGPREAGGGTDEFRPEVSASSIINALRLASVVRARVVLRCSFSYQHGVSRQIFDKDVFILIVPDHGKTPLDVGPAEALDLSRVSGGRAVVEAIKRHDDTSKDEIFGDL